MVETNMMDGTNILLMVVFLSLIHIWGVTRQKEDLTALIDWCQITVKGVDVFIIKMCIRDSQYEADRMNRQWYSVL